MNLKTRALKLYTAALMVMPSLLKVSAAGDDKKKESTDTGKTFLQEGQDLWSDTISKQDGATTQSTFEGVLNTLITVLGFVRTAGIIIAVLMLIYCAIQLASSAGNQQKRAAAMEGIKNVLIATAIIGGAALISQLALGILKN